MRRSKLLIGLFALLIALELAMIFGFSAEDAGTSSGLSLEVTRAVGRLIVPGFGRWSASEQAQWVRTAHPIVRKCAHFCEYALLGVLSAGACALIFPTGARRAWLPLAFCATCAALDEWHQTFVSGRSGELRDVLIDSGGAVCGLLLAFAASQLLRRAAKRKNSEHG